VLDHSTQVQRHPLSERGDDAYMTPPCATAALEPLMALLEKSNMQSGKALIDFIRTQNWHVIDPETKLVVLHEINSAIVKLRTRNGMSPLDDGLPGDRSTVFQTIRLIVVPFEEKPAHSFSAKQER